MNLLVLGIMENSAYRSEMLEQPSTCFVEIGRPSLVIQIMKNKFIEVPIILKKFFHTLKEVENLPLELPAISATGYKKSLICIVFVFFVTSFT
jgi:hypothetical protein